MKLLALLKRVRRGLSNFGEILRNVSELLTGAAASLLTGRLAPRLAVETIAREALIVCPSPLLNQQVINWERRSDYVIAFVNSACLSPTYLTLKPERFFLIDPGFFQAIPHAPGLAALSDETKRTVARIAGSTNWPMTIFVPWHYRNSVNARHFAANPNITVCGIPIFNSRGGNRRLKELGFRIGIVNPIYRNVLIAAIFYSLKAGHRRVLLWGAHHTWLKEVEVDGQNRVLHSVRHSEDKREGEPLLDNTDGSPRPYHDYLRQLSTIFEQYHILRNYAQRDGKEIINATTESFIDAFDRTACVALFKPDPDTAARLK